MPRSLLGGQHRRTVQKQRAAEAELIAQEAAHNREAELGTVSLDESIMALPLEELRTYAKDHKISGAGSRKTILARIASAFAKE